MPKRVSPIETIRAGIDTVFGSGKPIEECLEELMRHSVRLVLQQVLEDEVTSWLGRDWNARGDRQRQGQRNGHSDLSIKTTAGAVDLKRPKLHNTTETYASQLFGKGAVRSAPLEAHGRLSPNHRGRVTCELSTSASRRRGPHKPGSSRTVVISGPAGNPTKWPRRVRASDHGRDPRCC